MSGLCLDCGCGTKRWRARFCCPKVTEVDCELQDRELKELGFEYTDVDHIKLELPSALGQGIENVPPLANICPQLPSSLSKRHLASANGEMDQAVVPNMLETSTQVTSPTPTEDTAVATQDILIQMFPQYEQAGIRCAP